MEYISAKKMFNKISGKRNCTVGINLAKVWDDCKFGQITFVFYCESELAGGPRFTKRDLGTF